MGFEVSWSMISIGMRTGPLIYGGFPQTVDDLLYNAAACVCVCVRACVRVCDCVYFVCTPIFFRHGGRTWTKYGTHVNKSGYGWNQKKMCPRG